MPNELREYLPFMQIIISLVLSVSPSSYCSSSLHSNTTLAVKTESNRSLKIYVVTNKYFASIEVDIMHYSKREDIRTNKII